MLLSSVTAPVMLPFGAPDAGGSEKSSNGVVSSPLRAEAK